MEVAEVDSEKTEVYPTPGMQLKTAREALGLSIEEVAKESYIPTLKLESLENDQYEKLPSPIFVQGYLRKVAPLLKLDSDAIVSSYHDYLRQMQQTVEQVLQPEDEVALPGPVVVPPKWIVSGALAVIALLVLGVVYVFVGGGEEAPPTQTSELIAIDNDLDAPVDVVVGSDDGVLASDAVDRANLSSSTIVAGSADLTESAPSVTDGGQASTHDQLAFGFIEECWVEVEDATGETIHAALHAAGEPLIVEGTAPFTVMLGNAKAASIVKNGEPIAIDIRPGHRTARVTIE